MARSLDHPQKTVNKAKAMLKSVAMAENFSAKG
jgi:hypothetical protein